MDLYETKFQKRLKTSACYRNARFCEWWVSKVKKVWQQSTNFYLSSKFTVSDYVILWCWLFVIACYESLKILTILRGKNITHEPHQISPPSRSVGVKKYLMKSFIKYFFILKDFDISIIWHCCNSTLYFVIFSFHGITKYVMWLT